MSKGEKEIYRMNKPKLIYSSAYNSGKTVKLWSGKYGEGRECDGKLYNARFDISRKISLYINGMFLRIRDDRCFSKFDVWIDSTGFYRYIGKNRERHHELKRGKIEKILSTKIKDCAFWELFQARAKEIYFGENDERGREAEEKEARSDV